MSVKSHYYNGVYELRTQSVTANASTTSLDLSNYQEFAISLEANTELQLNNPHRGVYSIVINQTGAYTVSWPDGIRFEGGVPPVVSTVVGESSKFTVIYDGVEYYVVHEDGLS